MAQASLVRLDPREPRVRQEARGLQELLEQLDRSVTLGELVSLELLVALGLLELLGQRVFLV